MQLLTVFIRMEINKGRLNHTLLNDKHFVSDPLTMLVNNMINIFLINPNIILYDIFSLNTYGYQ